MPTLQEMLAEASAFRGEISNTPDPMVVAARRVRHRLDWGMTEQACMADLVEQDGFSPEDAFLAVKMGKVSRLF